MKHIAGTHRVHLNCHREGVVICPHCGHEKTINIAHYRDYFGGKALKGHCKKCSTSFQITFDYRQHTRVKVDFPGKLVQSTGRRIEGNILVTSLSVAGVGFVMSEAFRLIRNEVLGIRFCLDDADKSVIQEPVAVRRIHGVFVGAEYCQDAYRHALDFYVMRSAGEA